MGEPRVEWLTVGGDPDAWRAAGLAVAADGHVALFGTGLRIVPPGDVEGITGWALSGIAETTQISGLATEVVAPNPPSYAQHPVGAVELDHVVVVTDALELTSRALAAATGCELKRIRDAGSVRQGFHRIGRGGLIVELVERIDDAAPAVTVPTDRFWGLVINVEDIDAAYHLLGDDVMSAPKEAVQPGRRIATIRAEAGLGVRVALMTRDPR